jgi:hypothetical protein
MNFVLDKTVETNFTAGNIYRFKMSAENLLGEGPLSNYISIALAALPPKPNIPIRNLTLSTKSSAFI